MKKSILTFILLSCTFIVFGGKITVRDGQNTRLEIKESTPSLLVVDNFLGEINTFEIAVEDALYTKLAVPGYSKTQVVGSPELPVLRRLIEVPVGAGFRIEIMNSSYTDIPLGETGHLHTVMPTQLPVPKDGQAPDFELNREVYATNAFYPESLVAAENLGTLRSVTIGRLDIFPVQYNPVTHTLRVYDHLEVKVTFTGGDLGATMENKARYENPYFKSISASLINSLPLANRDTIMSYPVTYLIISDPMFQSQLQPFIEWKTKKGFHVIEAYTNDPQVGSTTFSIKSYIQGLYTNPGPGIQPPSFVLFVGDIDQVPTYTGVAAGHVTDLYYCEYTNDNFPEIYYGRFSAQNTTQLQPQIDKTLMYEQYTMPDPTYLNECVMIAGMDASFGPTHGNGQINYGTQNYFNETNGLFSHTYLYPESGSNAAAIRQNISDGVCYANYTAHGSPSGWADPEFTVGHIPQMTNVDQYALLVGNCCSTSEYQVNECFGEALLRAEDKGSLGYIGASNSTYWDEDYYWGVGVGPITGNPPSYSQTTLGAYDRTFHTHGEDRDDWYTTMDQMIFAGNLAVSESGSSLAKYYWEAYCLMGDPSLMVYFSEPPAMTVTYQPLLPLGTTSFTIATGEPFSYVAISMNGILYGAMQADESGQAVMILEPILVPGMADVVVTTQNRQPFIGTVLVANPEGPFILLESYSYTELAGNSNGKNEGNEVIGINIMLKNWGNTDGSEITAVISTADPHVIVSDGSEDCGTVPAQSTLAIDNAFSLVLNPTVPNGYEVEFVLQVSDASRETWSSEFKVLLSAPVLQCNSITIEDNAGGNGNGRLDPGETADIIYTLSNKGGVLASNVIASLTPYSGFIVVDDAVQAIGNMGLFGTKTVTYPVTVDSKASEGVIVDFELTLTTAAYVMNDITPVKIGLICEDFETGNLTKFPWNTGGNQPWAVSNLYPFEGNYSLKSGSVGNNESSEISLQYTSMTNDSISFYRKVSSESGDKLKFFIDNQLMEEWSGTTSGWRRACYPVTAGTHTYKWSYVKNGGGVQGSDAAWIDYILLPPPVTSTIFAGTDQSVCEGDAFQVSAQATNFAALLWSTSGTGTFNSNDVLNPVYTPSAVDILAGEVTLSLSMTDNNGAAFNDDMLLSFTAVPGTPATPAGPAAVDLSAVFTTDYTTESVAGATAYLWMVEPETAGIFVARGETGTIVWNRDWAGTAVIEVTATNQCGESTASSGFAVTVINGTVGIVEGSIVMEMKAYPNPAAELLHVELRSGGMSQVRLSLVNLTGAVVFEREARLNGNLSLDIPVKNLSSGIYLLVATDRNKRHSLKILVK